MFRNFFCPTCLFKTCRAVPPSDPPPTDAPPAPRPNAARAASRGGRRAARPAARASAPRAGAGGGGTVVVHLRRPYVNLHRVLVAQR